MFLGRLNGEGGKIFLETNAQDVATNLKRMEDAEKLNLEYWHIKEGANITLQKVKLKTGPRAAGKVTEVVVIEAGGEDVGEVEIEA